MDDSTKGLYDLYPEEDKSDFFPAYIYLKYLDHFMYHAIQACGLQSKEREELPDADIEEMLKASIQRVAETAPDLETSIYHGKVVKLKDAIQLVTQQTDLSLMTPEQVIPFKVAKDIILKNPQSIAVGTCACRKVSEKPCLPPPMEVCLIIGEPFASFIAEHNPLFRKSSQDEAVSILEAAHERGDVHCAYFKKDMGERFYFLCNCCSCCCLGVKMWNQLEGSIPILAPSGYLAHVGEDWNGCGSCESCCPFNALSMGDEMAVIDEGKCMGCGVCEDICPIGAITFERDPSKGEPLDLAELVSKTE
jgi:ferredoxin